MVKPNVYATSLSKPDGDAAAPAIALRYWLE
jgi:hypothetical protein